MSEVTEMLPLKFPTLPPCHFVISNLLHLNPITINLSCFVTLKRDIFMIIGKKKWLVIHKNQVECLLGSSMKIAKTCIPSSIAVYRYTCVFGLKNNDACTKFCLVCNILANVTTMLCLHRINPWHKQGFIFCCLVTLCLLYGSRFTFPLLVTVEKKDKLNPDFYRPQLQQARHPQKTRNSKRAEWEWLSFLMKLLFKAESQLWILQWAARH